MSLGIRLIGDGVTVPCIDGTSRPYINLDQAASTSAHPKVKAAVDDLLPLYSSIHRGAGYKSQVATDAYERARDQILAFANHQPAESVAVICRNTTEAINHLAYRLRLERQDVVATTVIEHHANLLPWARLATRRFVECDGEGRFSVEDVIGALEDTPRPKLLALTGASNVSGWLPPLDAIIAAAHKRDVAVLVDAAQLAPHRPLPDTADFLVFSGHKLYAPYGAGALIGPRRVFEEGDPFLAGGGAVELVDLEEVVWSDPPEREEAGSPNVLGAVALGAATEVLQAVGFERIAAHDDVLAHRLREGLQAIPGIRLLGPRGAGPDTLPVATFVLEGMAHGLVAARLAAEFGIGVRNGCFCAHPYLVRLLGLTSEERARFQAAARQHDHRSLPGAVRASTGLSSTVEEVDLFLEAVGKIAADPTPPVAYLQDQSTGEYRPEGMSRPGARHVAGCAPG